MSHFRRCIDFILIEEGGLVDHPQDPGGLTNHGISQRSYPRLDIRHLTRDDAKTIYRRDYWRPLRGGDHGGIRQAAESGTASFLAEPHGEHTPRRIRATSAALRLPSEETATRARTKGGGRLTAQTPISLISG